MPCSRCDGLKDCTHILLRGRTGQACGKRAADGDDGAVAEKKARLKPSEAAPGDAEAKPLAAEKKKRARPDGTAGAPAKAKAAKPAAAKPATAGVAAVDIAAKPIAAKKACKAVAAKLAAAESAAPEEPRGQVGSLCVWN